MPPCESKKKHYPSVPAVAASSVNSLCHTNGLQVGMNWRSGQSHRATDPVVVYCKGTSRTILRPQSSCGPTGHSIPQSHKGRARIPQACSLNCPKIQWRFQGKGHALRQRPGDSPVARTCVCAQGCCRRGKGCDQICWRFA